MQFKFGCEVTNCFGTSNRSLLPVETYDAVVFHSYDFPGDLAVSFCLQLFSRHLLFLEQELGSIIPRKLFDRFRLKGLGTRGMSTSCLNHLRSCPTLSVTTQYIRTRAVQAHIKAHASGNF